MKEALQLLESSGEIVEIDSGNMWDWEMDISSLQDKQAELHERARVATFELYEAHGQLQELATKIRELGVEGFLLQPELTELLAAADPAPIMLISVSMWRSDALVVRTEFVTLVPLPQLHEHDAVNHAEMPDNAKGAGGRASVLPFILGWLRDVAAKPALETGLPDQTKNTTTGPDSAGCQQG
ncbi:hypothetical protein Asppvi_008499 [Aspergillus pseudoviridinutans]|uniref:Uncharacterized protein n=1 Tax=Aspergillus pseudoviridinutans TaxID=1517512 RepID=A0A9P3EXG4_9EURO|nr:uncharacterized protein Asppvi_008499 [Aspergillus pseudoviridinutans]GIJ89557.1 hypothetical protein Asppvi_008499 [Aspergillus pseudoviridinutans]